MLEQEMVFGKFLRERRTRLSLTTAQLAAGVGYQNINKGIRRITAVENGETEPELTAKIMAYLGVTSEDRHNCLEQEALYRRRLIEKLPKFKPVLIWRAMACIYLPVELPENIIDQHDLLAYAAELARTRNSNCCLKLDYDLRYWISKNGEIGKADRRMENMPKARPDIGLLLADS